MLFVHGFTENTEAWRAWVPHFSRRYPRDPIDQRGFGQSGAVAKDFQFTTELYVDDLARVIKHVANCPVHVVGGKSGGMQRDDARDDAAGTGEDRDAGVFAGERSHCAGVARSHG